MCKLTSIKYIFGVKTTIFTTKFKGVENAENGTEKYSTSKL